MATLLHRCFQLNKEVFSERMFVLVQKICNCPEILESSLVQTVHTLLIQSASRKEDGLNALLLEIIVKMVKNGSPNERQNGVKLALAVGSHEPAIVEAVRSRVFCDSKYLVRKEVLNCKYK